MSVTLLPSATGGSNHSSYESVMAGFDRIFTDPGIPDTEMYRYGLRWARRAGSLVVPQPSWNGVGVFCLRPKGNEYIPGANTRLELVQPGEYGSVFASYVFSLGHVYNMADPHGGERFVEIREEDHLGQHYANVEALLSRVPELNPGQIDAGVTQLGIPQQPLAGEQAA